MGKAYRAEEGVEGNYTPFSYAITDLSTRLAGPVYGRAAPAPVSVDWRGE